MGIDIGIDMGCWGCMGCIIVTAGAPELVVETSGRDIPIGIGIICIDIIGKPIPIETGTDMDIGICIGMGMGIGMGMETGTPIEDGTGITAAWVTEGAEGTGTPTGGDGD